MSKTFEMKDEVLTALLPNIVFDGWTWLNVENAALLAGHDKGMAKAVFPDGLIDVLSHFSDWADRKMLETLKDVDPEAMRVRDRITEAVRARLSVLEPYKEAVKLAGVFWVVPPRGLLASRIAWRTADKIWNWAGDTATDYNHYTKRALLVSVMTSTKLAWMNDKTNDLDTAYDFLDRRIENVMQFGRILGKMKK